MMLYIFKLRRLGQPEPPLRWVPEIHYFTRANDERKRLYKHFRKAALDLVQKHLWAGVVYQGYASVAPDGSAMTWHQDVGEKGHTFLALPALIPWPGARLIIESDYTPGCKKYGSWDPALVEQKTREEREPWLFGPGTYEESLKKRGYR